ncbi:MAG: alanine--glyoxylate aminotransferase family protein [Candidatus Wallacebacter cryptica]|jgi:aspartate aminotransferase-like enzyme|nr:alanine--glyoxylate aminotransferase family protein [Bacillota bacterium]
MISEQKQLRIPGPTPIPHQVTAASASPMANHRGPEFKPRLTAVLERLKPVFQTKNTVLGLTGSGTSAMEAAVSNLINPGDPVLVLSVGVFGDRWAQICRAFQAEVHVLEFPWGEGVDPDAVTDYLSRHPGITAVFATHNESSTGVINDLAGIGAVLAGSDSLYIVDAVSSLGGVDLKTDEWGIDVVCTASQKCLMAPPGLAFISLSERAVERMKQVSSPRFYLNLQAYIDMLARSETPYTPNIPNFYAVEAALDLIEAEGLAQIFARHILMRDMVRAGFKALGMELLVEDKWASPTVTAVKPGFDDINSFVSDLRDRYGVELAGGQGRLSGQIFRIGHMGYAGPLDMLTALAAIETKLGLFGKATAAAEQVWSEALNSQT